MSISLQKGQKVDLTKGNAGLSRIVVGLGWDEAKPEKKGGLLGGIFGGNKNAESAIDCDAMAFACDESGKITATSDVVFFNNLTHPSGAIQHMGDNLTGAGDGDDEQIIVNLSAVPSQYSKIVFTVSIYQARQRQQHFGKIENAFIRIVDAATNQELCKYNLSDNYTNMTSVIFGEVYRHNDEWKFNAIGSGTTDDGVAEMARRFQ